MEKTVQIDGREVRLRASAAIPRLYRLKFRRDIIQDMRTIQTASAQSKAGGEDTGSGIPLEALTLLENVAYLMARHADPEGVPDAVDEWLEGFETFSIYSVLPEIQELWAANLETFSDAKKKRRRRKGKRPRRC